MWTQYPLSFGPAQNKMFALYVSANPGYFNFVSVIQHINNATICAISLLGSFPNLNQTISMSLSQHKIKNENGKFEHIKHQSFNIIPCFQKGQHLFGDQVVLANKYRKN